MSDRDDNLPPNFIIPPGTQVVLRYDRHVPGTTDVKPAGTVAEVVESPAATDRPYLVRFLDGTSFRLKFGELLARRGDHSVEASATPGPDVSAFVVYRVVVGSRAFGLSTESSDEDRRGVYLPPADWHWSLRPVACRTTRVRTSPCCRPSSSHHPRTVPPLTARGSSTGSTASAAS